MLTQYQGGLYIVWTRLTSYRRSAYRLTSATYFTTTGVAQRVESFAYAYDKVGNRQEYTRTVGSTPTDHHTYGYDEADRLTTVDSQTYTWDDNPLRCAAGTTRQLNKRRRA